MKLNTTFLRTRKLTIREKLLIILNAILLYIFLSMLFPGIVYSGFIKIMI